MCYHSNLKTRNNKRFWVMPWREHFTLKTCIQLWRGQWSSPMEALFWQEANRPWWRKRLPGLKRQYPVAGYSLDFAIPDRFMAIEIDGERYHSSPQQKYNDNLRQQRIENLGWEFIRFTGKDINSMPKGCVQYVRNRL